MAVYFKTDNAAGLLHLFNARIAQEEPKGKITTWVRGTYSGKDYYTHVAADWARQAWFTPVVEPGALRFNIIKPEPSPVSVRAYAYYHGHLTETFLAHFDTNFTDAISSAQPRLGDIIA